MNKPIRAISTFCLLLFLALMINVSYLQFWAAEDLNEHPGNARVAEAAFSRERGAIIVGRDPIARSVESDDRYEFLRKYPKPWLYANVTGYLQFASQTGLERSQNEILSGEDPRLFVNRLVDLVRNETNKGGNVLLTLDPEAQEAAYHALEAAVGPEGEGSVVAIEPKTGKILAMVSLPSYDPNELATHDFEAAGEAYRALEDDEREPLLNRAIQTRLFPGSTFKIVTAAAALDSGDYAVDDLVPSGATYQPNGVGNVIDNEGRTACDAEKITFETAMAWSCNTAFARMAVELGEDALREQAEEFGFNSDSFDDLPSSVESVFPTGDLEDTFLAQTGFGQFEVQATPLQMAMVAAAVANRGTLMKPYLVEEVQSAEYETLETTDPEELRSAIGAGAAQDLTDLLVATVDEGTANVAAIPGLSVAGKTGTAQRGDGLPPYAWFTSFAPAENAEVAVAVMIQEAPGKDISGGGLGGPVAKAVMEAVLQ
ncbi:peptidoglycan glycosyltransferase [Nocardioides thalensis]|uniref:Peptidoglycan glycosyltransferase n=1 Tax=Nocardioides thalensis TaxID=1914755 RepID=A0A853CB21_9ACTN|nr:penicillin-binding protein 2 [Nocardioides thalensis]NYJ03618.1 peptidoglycan glycosyltransferase [Nocardioides thalensis]